ncbi:MAG TPA: hypothetical protein PK705_07860, partial [Clostridia bacterium]|nr:hypothetical protein [Clostridia bacterium]
MKTLTKKICCIIVSILMMLTFTSCTSNALRGEKSIKIDELPDIDVPGVYYEIFVGGFSDSDEDGTG